MAAVGGLADNGKRGAAREDVSQLRFRSRGDVSQLPFRLVEDVE